MIPGDLLSAFPHRQFYTLHDLLDSWAALPNSNPNALRAIQGGSLYHFYDGLWYDPAERRTHDLPCERRTRYRLSQPDTVTGIENWNNLTISKCVRIAKSVNCISNLTYQYSDPPMAGPRNYRNFVHAEALVSEDAVYTATIRHTDDTGQ